MDAHLLVPDDLARVHFDAAWHGRLLIQRCRRCRRHQFYPRHHCAACFAPEPAWVEAQPIGELHTFSIVERAMDAAFAERVPYVFGVVALTEGVRVTGMIDANRGVGLRCGMRVEARFERVGERVALVNWRPA